MVADSPPLSASHHPTSPYQHENPMTPQRASQVFGFLTERRRSCTLQDELKNFPPLPALPLHTALDSHLASHFSDCSTESDPSRSQEQPRIVPHNSHINPITRTIPVNFSPNRDFPPSTRSRSNSLASNYDDDNDDSSSCSLRAPQSDTCSPKYSPEETPEGSTLHPVKLVVTAPTPANPVNQPPTEAALHVQSSRGPRGPRPRLSQHSTTLQREVERTDGYPRRGDAPIALAERHRNANTKDFPSRRDPFTPIRARRPKGHRRTASYASTSTFSLAYESDVPDAPAAKMQPLTVHAMEKWERRERSESEKENGVIVVGDVVVPGDVLTATPVSKHLRGALASQPSPASSSELSPVGQQLMMNLRLQRMHAREAERRERNRKGGRRR